jgi:excisionase family DNA binding protein
MAIGRDMESPSMVYTVEEVAKILRVSTQTVRKLIRQKKLKAFAVGSQLRIKKEELDKYMNSASL